MAPCKLSTSAEFIITIILTIVGIIGSSLLLVSSNTSLSSNARSWITIAGGVLGLLGNAISSITGYITPYHAHKLPVDDILDELKKHSKYKDPTRLQLAPKEIAQGDNRKILKTLLEKHANKDNNKIVLDLF